MSIRTQKEKELSKELASHGIVLYFDPVILKHLCANNNIYHEDGLKVFLLKNFNSKDNDRRFNPTQMEYIKKYGAKYDKRSDHMYIAFIESGETPQFWEGQ